MSSGRPGPHLGLAAQLHVDYANDPLVYEDVAGRADSELVRLVSDQVTTHVTVALGVADLALLYAGWQLHAVMLGHSLGDQPTATGFGSGDMRFGGRIAVFQSTPAAVALQLTVTAPTAESGEGVRPGVAGDSGATVEPEITADVAAGPFTLLFDVGARWRKDAYFAGARFTDLLTFGAGAALPVVPRLLRAHLELQGASPLDDLGDRSTSPLQALLGLKLTALSSWTFGVAGGAGLLRGYGSPDARAVLSIGHGAELATARRSDAREQELESRLDHEPPDEPAIESVPEAPRTGSGDGALELADADKDGVSDLDDRCLELPGRLEESGCPLTIRYDAQSGAIELLQPMRFEGNSAELQARSAEIIDEVAAVLVARPKARLHIEGHALHSRRRGVAQTRSEARALAVARALIDRGVESHRLDAFGCGDNRPLVPERSDQAFKNERIDLYVLDPLPPAGMPSTVGCTTVELPAPPPTTAAAAVQPTPPSPPVVKPAATPRAPAAMPAKPAATTSSRPWMRPTAAPIAKPSRAPAARAPVAKPASAPPPPPTVPPAPKPAAAPRAALPAVAGAATGAQLAAALAADPGGDRDGDGARNGSDGCPLAPGGANGCPEGHRVDLDAGRIELTKPIRFEPGAAALDARAEKQLDEIAATLRANPGMKVAIATHVAAEAGVEASLALTRTRAATVRRELTGRGIAPARMHAYGCGENRPVAPNNVPWGRKKNERVELLLLDPAPSSGVHSLEGCSAAE